MECHGSNEESYEHAIDEFIRLVLLGTTAFGSTEPSSLGIVSSWSSRISLLPRSMYDWPQSGV